jgi:hypothetical protein
MTIPYVPGWWDSISQNATGLMKQLPGVIQPDNVAQKRLQEMVQQNPMLLEQFSNMDDGTRNMLAQSLGFKNQNPIAQLPVGAQRQEREEMQGLRKEVLADPRSRQEFIGSKFGTKTDQERTIQDQQITNNDITTQIRKLDFKKMTRDDGLAELMTAESTRALQALQQARKDQPNLNFNKIISGLQNNRLDRDDLQQLQVISGDPYLSNALATVLDFSKLKEQTSSSLMLRSMGQRDDFARIAISAVESARKEYADSTRELTGYLNGGALSKISIEEAKKVDKSRAALIDQAMARRNAALNRLQTYGPIVDKSFGVTTDIPVDEIATQEEAPVNETPQQRLERLKRKAGLK